MTPAEFLRAVWPRTGIYCLYARIDGRAHWTYDTVDAAAQSAINKADRTDVYFALHTLKQKQVPHPNKVKPDGTPQTQTRVARNTLVTRCFYLDIDIKPDDEHYNSRAEALTALKEFIETCQLPHPMLVNSGRGFHVYWRLSEDIDSAEWADHATKLKQLTKHYGLKVDQKVTSDRAQILRVIGTTNRKRPDDIVPVELMAMGKETPTGVFLKLIADALIRAGVEGKNAPPVVQAEIASLLGSNTGPLPYTGKIPAMVDVLQACAQLKRLYDINKAGEDYSEPTWHAAVIGVARFSKEGARAVHKMSNRHSTYSEAGCNAKIKENELAQTGPTSCATIAARCGDDLCDGCPAMGVPNPIQAALKSAAVPAPEITELLAGKQVTLTIPDPPKPWKRTQAGIVVESTNADGSKELQTVYEYDLFPIRRLSNVQQGVEQHLWHVELLNNESKNFTLDADALYDLKKFSSALAHQGVYPNRSRTMLLQEYMTAYIKELQRLTAADAQCNHLGWAEDHSQFILPDKILLPDGTSKVAQLSLGAQRSSTAVHKRGTLQRQVELLRFYNHPQYIANQFFIMASIAAPIFYMTDHYGVIINATGVAGSSKSTTLYAAASAWGQPELYAINGTNGGATVRGRNERITVLANLPICVDEITNMPPKDMVDLAMGITQPGQRVRLQTDGVERAAIGSTKSTIMLTTSNNSMHGVISNENSQGTAGSMRVFEITLRPTSVHKKFEADDFLHELKQNYGHIGEQIAMYAIANQASVSARVRALQRIIDQRCNIRAAERFWSSSAAATIVAGEIAHKLGLLIYDTAAILEWVCNVQIPHMRGTVNDEYSDPLATLTNYLEAHDNNIIVVKKFQSAQGSAVNTVREPRGALLAHYDLDDQMMYVLKKGFKDYCARSGANASQIINDLTIPRDGERVVPQKATRRVLGAGTDYAKSQTWCFTINMKHPAVKGVADLSVVQGGGQGGADTGAKPGLQVVS